MDSMNSIFVELCFKRKQGGGCCLKAPRNMEACAQLLSALDDIIDTDEAIDFHQPSKQQYATLDVARETPRLAAETLIREYNEVLTLLDAFNFQGIDSVCASFGLSWTCMKDAVHFRTRVLQNTLSSSVEPAKKKFKSDASIPPTSSFSATANSSNCSSNCSSSSSLNSMEFSSKNSSSDSSSSSSSSSGESISDENLEDNTLLAEFVQSGYATSPCAWQDIIGLQQAKKSLYQAIFYPLLMPRLFESKILQYSGGILLHGEPGTGKTLLVRAIVEQFELLLHRKCTLLNLTPSTILSKWTGQSEKKMAAVFQLAIKHQPAIIFIDELDAFGAQRTAESGDVSTTRILTELLLQLAIANTHQHVTIIGATNVPQSLDPASKLLSS
jgi:hypothetical protein